MGSVLLSLKRLAYRLFCIEYKKKLQRKWMSVSIHLDFERRGSLVINPASYSGRRCFEFPAGHVGILKGTPFMVFLILSGKFQDNKSTVNSDHFLSCESTLRHLHS
jgi:hypothetical protein